ncbi:hypothetical protein ACFLVV_01105 [Chloroflexota bacterium]
MRLIGDRWFRRKQLRRRGEKTRRSRLSIFGKVQRKDDEGGFVRNLGLIGRLPHRRIVTALGGGIGSSATGFGGSLKLPSNFTDLKSIGLVGPWSL